MSERRVVRLFGIATLAVAVSVAHYVTPPAFLLWHNVFQRLYYVPLLLACAWFGLRGGLATSALCAALYAPHIMLHWNHMRAYQANQFLELALFGLIGLVGGILSDRERSLRRQAEAVAAERDRALEDLRETVQTLRQADRLATLGTLAAGMAHEIRNPLGAMGGALEILEKDYPDTHPRREFVDILRHEIGRLNRVVGRYLDYARPQPPERSPVEVNATVRSAVDLLQKSADRAGVRVRCRLDDRLPLALADAAQLHQAVVNLLLNGIQAMPSGGPLEVTTATASNGIRIRVRDHGDGLPEVPVDRIFEPFFSTRPGGTGLGLAVTRQIALSHGGGLSAENAEGGGAVFCLDLPADGMRSAP